MPLQLMDHEVLEEARGRQVAVPLDSDGREQLLDDVLAELRHLYGNVNTLFIHADKQVASHIHINSMGAFHCVCRCAHANFVCPLAACVNGRPAAVHHSWSLLATHQGHPTTQCVFASQLMEEQPEDVGLQQMQPSYEPPTPPEPPLTFALLVGGPGTAAARLESFRAAVGLAQVRPECNVSCGKNLASQSALLLSLCASLLSQDRFRSCA